MKITDSEFSNALNDLLREMTGAELVSAVPGIYSDVSKGLHKRAVARVIDERGDDDDKCPTCRGEGYEFDPCDDCGWGY